MSNATYVLGQPQILIPVVVVCVLFAVLVTRMYMSSPTARTGTRILCSVLKIIGFSILAFCLLEPLLRGTRPTPGENVFALLADRSQSLELKNKDEVLTRGDHLQKLLDPNREWQVRLEQDFDVRKYWIGTQLERVQAFDEFNFDDSESRLLTGLNTVSKRLKNRSIAGILFFTDGNATDQARLELDPSSLPPVFPIIQGKNDSIADLEVSDLTVTQTNFEASPVKITATVASRYLPNSEVIVELSDEEGNLIESQTILVNEEERVIFKVKPDKPGIRFYTISATYVDDLESMNNGEPSKEATLQNNSESVVVDRGGGPYRILYVSGRPNWEFKFLNRAIRNDPELRLVGLIRIAKKQPKFDFRRKGDTTTSDFFKGFDTDEEDAEQYFEPVLLRIGTEDKDELRGGFPKTAAELFRYDAVICDDVEAKYFSFEQMALIKRFVNERGGGFLMLGGQESFSEGRYVRTPIADLLPVYVARKSKDLNDGPSIQAPVSESFRYQLSRTGQLQPWMRLRATTDGESKRLESMPNFGSVNKVDGIKPGADEMAFVANPRGESHSALVIQNYGKGRSGSLLVGDLWRWGMNRPESSENDLETAWRQAARWLVGNVPDRVEINVNQTSEILSDYQIVIRVRDEEYQPLDNAELSVVVTEPDGNEKKMRARQSLNENGTYLLNVTSIQEGNHTISVAASNPDGTTIKTKKAGWVYSPRNAELKTLVPNEPWLTKLAEETGGEVIDADNIDSFVQSLPNRKLPEMETAIFPLWHHMVFFFVAIACLVSEWGIRRINGLP